MKKNKYLLMVLLTIMTFFIGTKGIFAQECHYGYMYSVDNKEIWDPSNQADIKASEHVWIENLVVDFGAEKAIVNSMKQNSNGILEYDYSQYTNEFFDKDNFFERDGSLWVKLNGKEIFMLPNANSIEAKIFKSGVLKVLYNISMNSAIVKYDFNELNKYSKYYNDSNSCPEIIVNCAVASESINFFKDLFTRIGITWDKLINFEFDEDTLAAFQWNNITVTGSYLISDLNEDVVNSEKFMYHNGLKFEKAQCKYYATNEKVDLNSCSGYSTLIESLKQVANKYGIKSTQYKEEKQALSDLCDDYIEAFGTSVKSDDGEYVGRACFDKCKFLNDDIDAIEGNVKQDLKCGSLGTELVGWMMRILKIIRYIIPVLVIILGIMDFIQATGSGDDDAMKKASKKFVRRLIAAIIIFLLPMILQFLFDIFNIPGLESGNAFCAK